MPCLTLMEKSKATTKAWFSCLLRHPARKRSGFILWDKTHTHTYLLTYLPRKHTGTKSQSTTKRADSIPVMSDWQHLRLVELCRMKRTLGKACGICLIAASQQSEDEQDRQTWSNLKQVYTIALRETAIGRKKLYPISCYRYAESLTVKSRALLLSRYRLVHCSSVSSPSPWSSAFAEWPEVWWGWTSNSTTVETVYW